MDESDPPVPVQANAAPPSRLPRVAALPAMMDKFVREVGEAPSPQRLVLFSMGILIPMMLSLTTFTGLKLWDHDKQLEVHNIEIKQLLEIVQRVDTHLSTNDSKYLDSAVSAQGIRGEVSSNHVEMEGLRTQIDQDRVDRIRDITALAVRVDRSDEQLGVRLQRLEDIAGKYLTPNVGGR